MGCEVDCVIMAAGVSTPDDIFNQPLVANRDTINPMLLQHRRIANLRARMRFHGGYASNLLVYCQVYCEWARSSLQSKTKEWILATNRGFQNSGTFFSRSKDFAWKTIIFVRTEFGDSMQNELSKLMTLAAIDSRPEKYGRNKAIPKFCVNIAIVQTANSRSILSELVNRASRQEFAK